MSPAIKGAPRRPEAFLKPRTRSVKDHTRHTVPTAAITASSGVSAGAPAGSRGASRPSATAASAIGAREQPDHAEKNR